MVPRKKKEERSFLSKEIYDYVFDEDNHWKTTDQIRDYFDLAPTPGGNHLLIESIGREEYLNRDVTPRKGTELDVKTLMRQVRFAYKKSIELEVTLDWAFWKELIARYPATMTKPITVRDTVIVPLLKLSGIETDFKTKTFITDDELYESAVAFFASGAYSVQEFGRFSKENYGSDRRLSFSNRWGLGNWYSAKKRLFAIQDTGTDPGIPGIYDVTK